MDDVELAKLFWRVNEEQPNIVPEGKKTLLEDYLDCRTIAKGFQVLKCDDCDRHLVSYNCNRRGCPVCSKKNKVAWVKSATRRLLPVGHQHLIFSFPQATTKEWMIHGRKTVGELFVATSAVMKKLESQIGLRLGCVMVFQSHGVGLSYKAHIHCLITDGGLDGNNVWQKLGVLPLEKMMIWTRKKLGLAQNDKEVRIYVSRHEKNGKAVVGYLGKSQFGAVIEAKNIEVSSETVKIETRTKTVELDPEVFLERYMKHVPEKGTVIARNYGLYSNRHKAAHEIARQQLILEEEKETEEKYQPLCPKCGTEMRVVFVMQGSVNVDFRRWGLVSQPPGHWEIGNAC